ncbi:MAG: helix-turn-helix transcriptional regulator [Chloroflexi bacterium]|nr:helix-turn-helix transcriptional regulator [Chloroflexota bacterium]
MLPPRSELNRLHAELCTAVADPVRIAILYTLADGPHFVNGIQEQLELPQSTISRHLRILRTSGIVAGERQGRLVMYRLADHRVIEAIDLLRQVMADRITARADTITQLQE